MNEIDPNNLFDGNKTNDDVIDIAIDVPPKELCKMPGNISELGEYVVRTQEGVNKLEERIAHYRGLQGWQFFFRGHSKSSYELVPSIKRGGFDISKEGIVVKELIEFGKSQQWDKFKFDDWDDDYFFMAIGRHLGLRCRMLDWTNSLKNAISFALHDNLTIKEKAIWILAVRDYDSRNKYNKLIGLERDKINISRGPEDYITNDFSRYYYPIGLRRRFEQCGCFTIPHTDNIDEPLDELLKKHPDENLRLLKIPMMLECSNDINFEEYEANYRDILPDIPCDIKKEIDRLNDMFTVL